MPDANADSEPNPNSHRDSYGNSHGNVDGYRNRDLYANGYRDSYGDRNLDAYGYGDRYTYSCTIGNADSKPCAERLCPVGWVVDEPSGSVVPRNHSGWVHDLYTVPGHRDHAALHQR